MIKTHIHRFVTSCLIVTFFNTAYAEISEPVFGTLDNGLSYAILPLHEDKGRLDIRLKVHAGSIDEADHQAGVAHMVEHLVFRGTQAYPDGIMTHLHNTGWVRAKHYNAVTTYDNTTYMLSPPVSAGLNNSLNVLSQMMFFATLSANDLDNERQIITEEWRGNQGVAARMNAQRTQSVRANSRYTRHPVIGTYESIQNMSASELQQFYQTWYAPNNMQLMIIGDVETDVAKQAIATHFGSIPQKTLPIRNYYEPILSNTRRITELKDPQSGVSQVAYIFRMHNHNSRRQDEIGRKQRLIERLATAIITERLKNEQSTLPAGVNSLVLRKSDIGKATIALGFFSSVDVKQHNAHRTGLYRLLTEIHRLKNHPITDTELDIQRTKLQSQIDNAKTHTGDRDFVGWVNAMNNSFFSGLAYHTQPQLAEFSEVALHAITTDDINQKIQEWLSAGDVIVQYQTPHSTTIIPFSESEIQAMEAQIHATIPTPPTRAPVITDRQLSKDMPHLTLNTPAIVHSRHYPKQNVTYFTLANGDTVIWLKSELTNNTILRAVNSAGFMTSEYPAWQSQVAAQLITQNTPLDWSSEEYTKYKNAHKLSISVKQTATNLSIQSSSPNAIEAVNAYLALTQHTSINQGHDDAIKNLSNLLTQTNNTPEDTHRRTISQLRYHTDDEARILPTTEQLTQSNTAQLNQIWQQMAQAPTTFYLMNNANQDEVMTLISPLASLPRGTAITTHQPLATTGTDQVALAYNIEPKSDVKLWTFSELAWTGKDAMMVAMLQDIATTKLKTALRDEALGIYRLNFSSTLNPKTNRIESELSFTTDPAKADTLITLAQKTLENLPHALTESDILHIKGQFTQQERSRLEYTDTWLNRLVLSHEHDGTPTYLDEMQYLSNHINLSHARTIAQKIYNPDNVKIFIATPLKENNP